MIVRIRNADHKRYFAEEGRQPRGVEDVLSVDLSIKSFPLLVSEGGDEDCNLIIFIQSILTSMPFIVFPDDYSRTVILKN